MCAGGMTSPFHVGLATPDVDGVQALLSQLLGVVWVPLERPPVVHHTPDGPVRPSPRVSYSAQGPLHLEVLEAAAGTVYDPDRGTHIHHLGYWTDDFAADLATACADGWSLEVCMHDEAGRPAIFAYLTRPARMRVELVDAVGRPAFEALLAGKVAPNHGPALARPDVVPGISVHPGIPREGEI
jgi:Glyoxalase/Bleomycin resistance protein/Dioxygenase superfamily